MLELHYHSQSLNDRYALESLMITTTTVLLEAFLWAVRFYKQFSLQGVYMYHFPLRHHDGG